jgi:cytochrome c553
MKHAITAFLVVVYAAGGPAMAAGDPAAGKSKSATCTACHGADGNSTNPQWPKLAGQHEGYLYKQLKDYKSGNRVNATMQGMVAALSDQDMKDLAAYFASQQAAANEGDAQMVGRGQEIYRGGITASGVPACMGCHSPSGDGNPAANFPSLAGQHQQYTVEQLMKFKSHERANDGGKMMRNLAARLTDAQMEQVAEYIAAMKVKE